MASSPVETSPRTATDELIDRLRATERRLEATGDRADRPVRILALDGGGIRGLIPARVLQHLEGLTKRPIADCFDIVAGTSTGGILALGLTVPDPSTGAPCWSAEDLAEMYRRRGSTIFHHSLWRDLADWLVEKYSARGLDGVLRDKLADAKVADALTEVLLTSWDLSANGPAYFATHHRGEVLMREAARATSAAPTYFKPLWLRSHALVDGGVFANDPAHLAWMAKRDPDEPRQRMLLVSLGTGAAKAPDPSKRRFWGTLPWARPIIDVLLTAPSELVERELREAVHRTGLEYHRLQPDISGASPRLDDVTRANLDALDRAAEALIASHEHELAAIAARL